MESRRRTPAGGPALRIRMTENLDVKWMTLLPDLQRRRRAQFRPKSGKCV